MSPTFSLTWVPRVKIPPVIVEVLRAPLGNNTSLPAYLQYVEQIGRKYKCRLVFSF
jgi:hypothetical protein